MQEETQKQFILVLNGPMCAGKSTITHLFMTRLGVFRGAYDRLKWLIGNYSAENQSHRDIAKEMTFATVDVALGEGLSVVVDGAFGDFRDRYKKIAEKYDVTYLSLNIEAPLDVLKERFLQRVESAQKIDAKKISVTTLEGFQSRYDWYISTNKDPEAETLDSGHYSEEELFKMILQKLQ
jgi:predicted kinase